MAESKEDKEVNIAILATKLGGLKDRNTKNSDYIEVLKQLHYDDSVKIRPSRFDAVLVKSIDEELLGINKDIAAMSLGLLLGYERDIKIGLRRDNYLKNSNFITDFYYDNRGPYDKVSKDQKRRYKDSLIDAEDERLQDLAEFLAKKIKNDEFNEFIKDLTGYYDSGMDAPILLKPEYIKKRKRAPKPCLDSNVWNDNSYIPPDNEPENGLSKGENEIKSESKIPEKLPSDDTISELGSLNIQANEKDALQDKNEPKDSGANDNKKYKRRKKRKVNMSAKSESTAVAAAGSYVSVHIVNVVGEPKKSNNATLIQGIGEKIQKIFLLGSEGLVEQSPDSLDKDKTRKRNRRVSKRNMLGVILVLVVLFIIVIEIFQSPQSTPVMSDYPLQSEQEWLKLNMENMNREMGGNTVNGVKATIEYSITDPDTSQEYTYTKALSLEQNTAELEEPVDENIN